LILRFKEIKLLKSINRLCRLENYSSHLQNAHRKKVVDRTFVYGQSFTRIYTNVAVFLYYLYRCPLRCKVGLNSKNSSKSMLST